MAMYDENPEHERRRLERLAANYNPDTAAEYDRIRKAVPDDKIPLMMRMAMGYSDSARDAANQLNNEK